MRGPRKPGCGRGAQSWVGCAGVGAGHRPKHGPVAPSGGRAWWWRLWSSGAGGAAQAEFGVLNSPRLRRPRCPSAWKRAGAGFGGAADADSAGSAETQGRKGAGAHGQPQQVGEPGSLLPNTLRPLHPTRSGAASPGEAAAGLAPPSGSFLAGFWGPGHPRTTLSHQAGRAVR